MDCHRSFDGRHALTGQPVEHELGKIMPESSTVLRTVPAAKTSHPSIHAWQTLEASSKFVDAGGNDPHTGSLREPPCLAAADLGTGGSGKVLKLLVR
jgi:hypothetical protein